MRAGCGVIPWSLQARLNRSEEVVFAKLKAFGRRGVRLGSIASSSKTLCAILPPLSAANAPLRTSWVDGRFPTLNLPVASSVLMLLLYGRNTRRLSAFGSSDFANHH